jgi:hypothetical protein
VALVPRGTEVEQLARVAGISPGLMSAGLGSVPAAQTYLDISQGNRVFDSLYDSALPRDVRGGICGPSYSKAVVERAESAPAEIEPGLLAATLAEHGEGCRVRSVGLGELGGLVRELDGNDLLIAIERAPPEKNRALVAGIAGRDFGGNLTSDSTRTDGYVLSTDVAPTILERLGIAVPSQMSGQPIRSTSSIDVGAIESLADRMAVISARRGPVIGISLLIWLVAFGLAALVSSDRVGHIAVRLAGLSIIYLPLLLLAAARLEPSQESEQLLVMFGAPLLAALTLFVLGGLRALAVGSAVVVLAYAVDMVAGSPLTSLSLLGPNPGLGVRFYGIGNELEAMLCVLVVAGTGVGLVSCTQRVAEPGARPRLSERGAAAVFLATALLSALIFAAGRFGADVGAAIVFPVGGAVAAVAIGSARRRMAVLAFAAPLAVLALIALADLISGANAHLTRSVLDAGGLGDLADVAQRRLQLSVHSFARPVVLIFLPLIAALAVAATIQRDRLRQWLAPVPTLRAGLIGAVAATLIGTLANDSGALVLEIGAAYILVFAVYAWSERST